MDGEDRFTAAPFGPAQALADLPTGFETRFTAEAYRAIPDAAARRARIADIVGPGLAPRLQGLHAAVPADAHPGPADIAELARLVLSPDERDAAAYVSGLRRLGVPVERLLCALLEPAARRLGELWDEDAIDFIDVTLGVARLQALLSIFNGTHRIAGLGDRRSVLMLTVPGEQHSFGIAMVEQLLEAGGWQVRSEREAAPAVLARAVERHWFAVAGIAVSNPRNLEGARAAIALLRARSRNPAIGIMVGGPLFRAEPGLAREIGADGTASSGPMAVVLAQKLLDDALSVSAPPPSGAAPASAD